MNLAIQILTLLSGLLVNFLVPAVYGLTEYGLFVKANVLVFLFQKLSDIAGEPLIAELDSHFVLPVSAALGCLVLALFMVVGQFSDIGDPRLLAAMLLSSSVLLSMYAARWRKQILVYLIAFLAIFSGLLTANATAHLGLSIEAILIWTNLVPALGAGAALILASRLPRADEFLRVVARSLGRAPRLLTMTLVFNLLTNILPYVLSKTLPVRELGLYRVVASVVQSATSFFPVNTKAILATFVHDNCRSTYFRKVMGFSLAYFSILGGAALCVSIVEPRLAPYVPLIGSLPTLYWAVLTERYRLAERSYRAVLAANITIAAAISTAMFFVGTVEQAVILVAVGFSGYLAALLLPGGHGLRLPLVLWVVVGSVILSIALAASPLVGLAYFALTAAVAVRHFRLNLATLRQIG